MADYGLWTWAPGNVAQITPESFTMRVVYTGVADPGNAPAGKYWDISIPGVTPENSQAFCIPLGPINRNLDRQLEPEVVNGAARIWRTIRGDPYGNSSYTSTKMRLVVVRFK
ncbi:hypothetical protein [Pseudomonas sp. PS01296]|uniref:hypothetical protein n=1 Tax=Pseudomonas sp. PS01296 TaxID=2991432 RepID=UPI00249CCB30|nr:hypothetical protein [Pseudomonas sp. PS01296]